VEGVPCPRSEERAGCQDRSGRVGRLLGPRAVPGVARLWLSRSRRTRRFGCSSWVEDDLFDGRPVARRARPALGTPRTGLASRPAGAQPGARRLRPSISSAVGCARPARSSCARCSRARPHRPGRGSRPTPPGRALVLVPPEHLQLLLVVGAGARERDRASQPATSNARSPRAPLYGAAPPPPGRGFGSSLHFEGGRKGLSAPLDRPRVSPMSKGLHSGERRVQRKKRECAGEKPPSSGTCNQARPTHRPSPLRPRGPYRHLQPERSRDEQRTKRTGR
jgi:hypothetical protein